MMALPQRMEADKSAEVAAGAATDHGSQINNEEQPEGVAGAEHEAKGTQPEKKDRVTLPENTDEANNVEHPKDAAQGKYDKKTENSEHISNKKESSKAGEEKPYELRQAKVELGDNEGANPVNNERNPTQLRQAKVQLGATDLATHQRTTDLIDLITYKASEEEELYNGGYKISLPGEHQNTGLRHVHAHDGFHNIQHEPLWAHWNDAFTTKSQN